MLDSYFKDYFSTQWKKKFFLIAKVAMGEVWALKSD